MTRVGLLVPVLLLLAGCVPSEDPLVPELKGRWAMAQASKVRASLATDGRASVPRSLGELCQASYLTFDRHAIKMHNRDREVTFFVVRAINREGPRITATIGVPYLGRLLGGNEFRLELRVGNGEIHFVDLKDYQGNSLSGMRYDEFGDFMAQKAQRTGLSTAGEVFGVRFDLKSCGA